MVIRTLIVDDHRSYAEALSFALARADGIEPIGCAFTIDEAVVRAQEDEPNVVLLDWQLPEIDGVEGIGRIKAVKASIKVVLVSGHASGKLERLALSAGASAVLPKESSIADVVSTVRRCASGEVIATALSSADSSETVALTPRETEILWMLAKGVDAPHIATELYISVHTVRGYIKDLRRKFAAGSQLQVIALARAQGLLPD